MPHHDNGHDCLQVSAQCPVSLSTYGYVPNWGIHLTLLILFAICAFTGVIFLPESPRWLIAHDRIEEARQVLWSIEIDARSMTPTHPKLEESLNVIKMAIDEEREAASSSSYLTLLKDGKQKFRYRTLLGMGGQFIQQLSGRLLYSLSYHFLTEF